MKDYSNSPLDDSSGDEDGGNAMDARVQFDISVLLPHLSTSSRTLDGTDEEKILSTFQPKPNENIFFLSETECFSMGLAFPSSLVCMNNEDRLCLLGICGLKVLQGVLNIFGAILQASPVIYQVYAPRYFPLPIIQASNDRASSLHLDKRIPHQLRHLLQTFNAVFAFQRLDSGIERLSDICRPFQGMFEPSKWQKNNVFSPFAFHNLHMVQKIYIPYIISSLFCRFPSL